MGLCGRVPPKGSEGWRVWRRTLARKVRIGLSAAMDPASALHRAGYRLTPVERLADRVAVFEPIPQDDLAVLDLGTEGEVEAADLFA